MDIEIIFKTKNQFKSCTQHNTFFLQRTQLVGQVTELRAKCDEEQKSVSIVWAIMHDIPCNFVYVYYVILV